MKTVALYARVSTSQQEKEETIKSQLELLLAYGKEQGYLVPTEYQFRDQAISGSNLARPGLDRLRDLATTGTLQIILCLSPDRLARNFGHQRLVLDELGKNDVKVIFLNQPSLGDSPQEQLLLNVQGAFAEYERAAISERMRRGRRYKLSQGLSVPWSISKQCLPMSSSCSFFRAAQAALLTLTNLKSLSKTNTESVMASKILAHPSEVFLIFSSIFLRSVMSVSTPRMAVSPSYRISFVVSIVSILFPSFV